MTIDLSLYEVVYVEKFFRIGDEVVALGDEEARQWRRDIPAIGTKGTVIGFYDYLTTENYGGCYNGNLGIYRENGAAWVAWGDGKIGSSGYIAALPKTLIDERRKDTRYMDAFTKKVKLAEIPAWTYTIGNKIETKDGEIGTIFAIAYEDIVSRTSGCLLSDSIVENTICIDVNFEEGYSRKLAPRDISRIIDHGNYWKLGNNRTDFEFRDLKEEIGFYKATGKTKDVPTKEGKYVWELEEALQALEAGEVDGFYTGLGLFGLPPKLRAYKFDKGLEDLAKRTREKTIDGFKNRLVDEE